MCRSCGPWRESVHHPACMPAPTVLLCMGTRPEIIKMAPVYHALADSPLRPVVLHTGQHSDIAWPLYEFFGMAPDVELDLTRERPSLGHLNARLLDAVDGVISEVGAEAVLVHGDTSSALAAAMASFYAGTPVGHVEAGLRSGNPMDPFPEEMNRTVIAKLARWHFAPTRRAVGHLVREGCAPGAISLTGNTVVDAVRDALARTPERVGPREAEGGRTVLVTMHRRENWGRPIEEVARAVGEAVRAHPDLRVVWPMHPNPDVRAAVRRGLGAADLGPAVARVELSEPLDYAPMLHALRDAWLVLTDSGGIQEEAAALDRPVLVLRRTTERPELIEAGGGALVGTDHATVLSWLTGLATDPVAYGALRCPTNPYGDGRAGERVAAVLAEALAHRAEAVAPSRPEPLPAAPPARLVVSRLPSVRPFATA